MIFFFTARLPFKPLHTAQYGSDGVAIKKRKLIDTNANFEQAKTLKKTEEEREIIEIDCNSDVRDGRFYVIQQL